MSPAHLKHLKNMGVRSTMSISLDYKDELWGLICCHNYGPTGLGVPFPIRELCYWLGLTASKCLECLVNAERLANRSLISTMRLEFDDQLWLAASSSEFLRLFQADFGFLVVQGEARTIGTLSSYVEAVTMLRYVHFRNFDATFASKNITKDFPDLICEPGFERIAGLLVIPLSQVAGDFIILCRQSQTREVHWAVNPNLSKRLRTGRLVPRNSFKKWTETKKKTCIPWTEDQSMCTQAVIS